MTKEELKPIDVSKYTITETGQVLKMNKNKCFLNGDRGSGRSFRLLCETYENRIAELEKENAELKSENQKWKDEWQEQVQKATDEGYARTLQTIQLTKAKELLKEFVHHYKDKTIYIENMQDLLEQVERFIKDSEVEK